MYSEVNVVGQVKFLQIEVLWCSIKGGNNEVNVVS